MTEQPQPQACPSSSPLTGGFRQHLHAVTCEGDVDDARHPHKVHIARCVPIGHVCPSCALDWPQVRSKWPRPGWVRDRDYQPPEGSAQRIKAALDNANARRRERDATRAGKDS